MKKIEKKIIRNLTKELRVKDKIILWIMRKYTYKIYRIGFNDGYYFKK